MKLFKPTLVSLAVGACLASAAVNAAPKMQPSNALSFASLTDKQQTVTSHDASFQQLMASKATRSGMKSSFDSKLGKTTFLWAPKDMAHPDMSSVSAEQQAKFAADFYMSMLTGVSATKRSANNAVMSFMHQSQQGTMVAKYRQQMYDIDVFNREYNVIMDSDYNLVAASGYFSQSALPQNNLSLLDSFGSAHQAVKYAFSDLSQGEADILLSDAQSVGKYHVFTAESANGEKLVSVRPRAKQVWFDSVTGLVPAYYVEVGMAAKGAVTDQMFSYVVDANTGKILFKNDLIQQESSFTYRAYLEQSGYPLESPHGDVSPTLVRGQDPVDILDAPLVTLSNFAEFTLDDPWLPEDADSTAGNNVFAYADLQAPQGFSEGDIVAQTTSTGTFDYQLTLDEDAQSDTNINAAIVNLFVVNNFLHDYYYDFGFTEAAGNAQFDNFGRGGIGGDPLFVEAQDSSGLNNANMATPADGSSPRMQMFLFNSKDATEGQDFGATISVPNLGLITSATASFGAVRYDVSGSIVRVEDGSLGADGTGTVFDGCEPATNPDALAGNIAIVDRGSCFFTVKALNAQAAGAIGVMIANNNDDGTPAPVGGADDNVTIPTRGITFADAAQIYAAIDDGQPASGRIFENFLLKDGTLDTGIIAHEFGHYIQNRLVGNATGLGNFQGRAMGEGWSDFHALLFQAEAEDAQIQGNENFQANYGVGTFVVDFFQGIRRAPYSVNMEVNPLTFQHITAGAQPPGIPATNPNGGNAPHPPGELWAVSLWDIYVGLIDVHGFEEAQDRMSQYVIEGLMLTPINPLYTEARDAILAAIVAQSQSDFELALAAFTRRGMGLGAVSPNRDSTTLDGVVESFSSALSSFTASDLAVNATFDSPELGFCSNDDVLDVGETGTITFDVFNNGSEVIQGQIAQISVFNADDELLTTEVTIENDGLVLIPDVQPFTSQTVAPVLITLNEAGIGDQLRVVVTFPELEEGDETVEANDLSLTGIVNLDFALGELEGNVAIDEMETLAIFEDWQENVLVGGEDAEGTQRFDQINTAFFQSRNPNINLGTQTQAFNNNPFESDVAFETRAFTVADEGEFEMSFWHFYLLEETFDGGVVEVSVDGGDWIDVTDAGGEFSVGYPVIDTLVSTALNGRRAYTGTNAEPGFPIGGTGNIETISFGSQLNGSEVRFRFRLLTDINTASFGWNVDNVTFTNVTTPIFSDVIAGDSVACDPSMPLISLAAGSVTLPEDEQGSVTANVTFRNDMSDFDVDLVWEQISGPAATGLSGVNSNTLTFTPPQVSSTTNLQFQFTATAGEQTASDIVTVTVTDVPPPRSGGGSTGWLTLLLAPIAWVRRRNRSK